MTEWLLAFLLALASTALGAADYTRSGETVVVTADRAPVTLGGTTIAHVEKGRWFGVRDRKAGDVGICVFSGKNLRIGWIAAEHVQTLRDDEVDLTAEALKAALAHNPQLDVAESRAQIDAIAERVVKAAEKGRSPLHRAILIRSQLFGREGFRYDQRPRTLEGVLAEKRGNCLGLSILYLCAAEKLDLPLQMIAIPGHVLLRYEDAKVPFNIEPAMMGMVIRTDGYLLKRFGPKSGQYPRVLSEPKAISVLLGDMGALLAEQKRYKEAEAAFIRSVEVDPDHAAGYYNWGVTLSRQKRLGVACDKFARAVQIYPRFAQALVGWGCVLAKLEDTKGACRKFARAVEIEPRLGAAWFNWGSVLLSVGRRAEAWDKLARAEEVRPALKPVIDQLRTQRGAPARIQLVD